MLILGLSLLLPKTPQGKLTALAELGAAVSVGSTQIGEQKAPQVQANVLAAVPLLKRLFGGKQGNKGAGAATKPTEPTPQPEWFNAMAAGMKFTIYDENGTAQYSQTIDIGTVPPEEWGKLMQTFTAHISGVLEVEIFNDNIGYPVFFDDWHITLTENPKPEVKSPQPQRGVDAITSKTPPSGAGGLSDGLFLFNGKELQTYADLHLYDYHWRHWDASRYDPQLGRWHSPDPADQFHGLSGYAYCANNPVMLTDPDGRVVWFVPILIGMAIGGIMNTVANSGNIGSVWDAFKYFGVGAAAGGVSAIPGVGTLGGLGLAALGGSINAGGNAWIQGTDIGRAMGQGAISGFAGGVFSSIGSNIGGTLINGIAVKSPLLNGLIKGTVLGGMGGGFAGAGLAAMDGGDIGAGFLSGLATGAVAGAASGSAHAFANAYDKGINPFTGKSRFPMITDHGTYISAKIRENGEDFEFKAFKNIFEDGKTLTLDDAYLSSVKGGIKDGLSFQNLLGKSSIRSHMKTLGEWGASQGFKEVNLRFMRVRPPGSPLPDSYQPRNLRIYHKKM